MAKVGGSSLPTSRYVERCGSARHPQVGWGFTPPSIPSVGTIVRPSAQSTGHAATCDPGAVAVGWNLFHRFPRDRFGGTSSTLRPVAQIGAGARSNCKQTVNGLKINL